MWVNISGSYGNVWYLKCNVLLEWRIFDFHDYGRKCNRGGFFLTKKQVGGVKKQVIRCLGLPNGVPKHIVYLKFLQNAGNRWRDGGFSRPGRAVRHYLSSARKMRQSWKKAKCLPSPPRNPGKKTQFLLQGGAFRSADPLSHGVTWVSA